MAKAAKKTAKKTTPKAAKKTVTVKTGKKVSAKRAKPVKKTAEEVAAMPQKSKFFTNDNDPAHSKGHRKLTRI
jgi:hypothetical protein